jgi:hypothetical protein
MVHSFAIVRLHIACDGAFVYPVIVYMTYFLRIIHHCLRLRWLILPSRPIERVHSSRRDAV